MADKPDVDQQSIERDYPAAFADYRDCAGRMWAMYAAGFMFMFAFFVAAIPLSWMGPNARAVALAVVAVAFVLLIVVPFMYFGSQLMKWKCPHCHNAFHSAGAYYSVTNRKCLHCKIRMRCPSASRMKKTGKS